MSELLLKNRNGVGIRAEMTDVPLHLCMENFCEITGLPGYMDNATITVEGVAFVKDAP